MPWKAGSWLTSQQLCCTCCSINCCYTCRCRCWAPGTAPQPLFRGKQLHTCPRRTLPSPSRRFTISAYLGFCRRAGAGPSWSPQAVLDKAQAEARLGQAACS